MEYMGMVFGIIGFVFGLIAMGRIEALEKKLKASGVLPPDFDSQDNPT